MIMAESGKKISFGFSKLKKPTSLVKPVEIAKPEVEYVDSFDGAKGKFSYKGNVRCDEPVKKELVIPLIGTKSVLEVIRSKLEEKNAKAEDEKTNCVNDSQLLVSDKSKENGKQREEEAKDVDQPKEELSIEDLAAREILNDIHNNATTEKASNTMVIKQPSKVFDEKEIPIDYENIPVNDFGLAMLRGMGWTPDTGIGKEQKVVQVVAPKLRPKGLGLGADKVVLQQAKQDPDLTITIKGYVKFVNGTHKGSYGQVEAMDDDNSRVVVKLALGGTVSASEMLLVPVTKKDYDKNSKVINSTKYETFKAEKTEPETRVEQERKHDDNYHRKEKYKRKDAESDRHRRRDRHRRSTSSLSEERRSEHKKKKKERRQDDSRERRHKKSKKKRTKKQYSSEDESESSDDSGRHKPESASRSHSHKSKSRSTHR